MRRIVALGLIVLGSVAASAAAQQGTGPIQTAVVPGKGPLLEAKAFEKASSTTVTLLPQVITTPRAATPSVSAISVRAARNADHLGVLLEWADTTGDWRTGVDHFGDAVALAFPLATEPMPAPTMGNPNGRIQILQWRADWQSDVEKGAITVAELYPNAYKADFYHEDHLPAQSGGPYRGAAHLGNAMSQRAKSSVQELVAEGFGSLTPSPNQTASGRGRYEDGRWSVILTRPLTGQADTAPALTAGSATQVAFAVWNGSNGEVGARKAWFGWVPFEVAK